MTGLDFHAIALLAGPTFLGCCLLRVAWSIDRNTEARRDREDW